MIELHHHLHNTCSAIFLFDSFALVGLGLDLGSAAGFGDFKREMSPLKSSKRRRRSFNSFYLIKPLFILAMSRLMRECCPDIEGQMSIKFC